MKELDYRGSERERESQPTIYNNWFICNSNNQHNIKTTFFIHLTAVETVTFATDFLPRP